MTVKWLGTIATDKPHDNYWLTVGRIYTVLAISVGQHEVLLRIIGNDSRTPALFPLSEFEIVSGSLPGNWAVSINYRGSLELGPSAWMASGLWEDYFNGEERARDIFEREPRFALDSSGGVPI